MENSTNKHLALALKLCAKAKCKFIVEPYGPCDPFRGRYVALSAEQSLYGDGRHVLMEEIR
jgi:hypothetical protein